MGKNSIKRWLAVFLSACLTFAACTPPAKGESLPAPDVRTDHARTSYEIFVGSFADSNGDGIGDLNGIRQKLDYLNDGEYGKGDDLEVTALWLTPVFPSPTYHKYDATDYYAIDPAFGTEEDYVALIEDCHARGMEVYMDLAVNHTSSEHPWFTQAADYLASLPDGQEPEASVCKYVDWYHFSREQQAGYEPLGDTGWYYEARFWGGMPDLNLDNPDVREEIRYICDYWLYRGVDGFRLDAVTSYYTDDQAASIEFLSWMRGTVDSIKPGTYLVAECWSAKETVARYYASGVDSFFDFAFAGADGLIASVTRGNRRASAWAEAVQEAEALYAAGNPAFIDAPFYTNHDMARSAGYYSGDDGTKVKFAQALNLLMSGNAFLYYGEEIGMKGSGKDENFRAPMLWTSTGSDAAMTAGPPYMDKVTHKFPGVSEQLADEASILNFVRKVIRARNSLPAIAGGRSEAVDTGSEAAGLIRREDGQTPVLILVNDTDASVRVNLTGQILPYRELAFSLHTGEKAASISGSTVTVPAYGIAILTGEKGE